MREIYTETELAEYMWDNHGMDSFTTKAIVNLATRFDKLTLQRHGEYIEVTYAGESLDNGKNLFIVRNYA